VVAFLVRRDGLTDGGDVLEWCRERLAPYKRPREAVVLAELPLGPTGKVDKVALRGQLRSALAK
jgi:acyl-CoA synthetase (AMP-forming)/AMP-acid ligase II